jgi:putative acetyltransferase
VLVRREQPADIETVRAIVRAAFALPLDEREVGDVGPPEVILLDALRADRAWLPALSLVAIDPAGTAPIGHVVCTRAHVGDLPVLGLGPLAVRPDQQGRGVGSALMQAVLGAADALSEPLVALLGAPGYYRRFGFRISTDFNIMPPEPGLGGYFQVRPLTTYRPSSGTFRYAAPFDEL